MEELKSQQITEMPRHFSNQTMHSMSSVQTPSTQMHSGDVPGYTYVRFSDNTQATPQQWDTVHPPLSE